MDNKSLIPYSFIVLMIMVPRVPRVSSDFAQDKKQCQDQLISLSSCLTYVSGNANAPTPTCCAELKKDVDKSKLCLCILVKDRDNPGLGFKLNATLAMSLIPICQVHTNATICPELLHLAPNSPEAQVFEQLGNISSTRAGEIVPSSSANLIVEGLRFTWVLVSVSISSIFVLK